MNSNNSQDAGEESGRNYTKHEVEGSDGNTYTVYNIKGALRCRKNGGAFVRCPEDIYDLLGMTIADYGRGSRSPRSPSTNGANRSYPFTRSRARRPSPRQSLSPRSPNQLSYTSRYSARSPRGRSSPRRN